MRGKAKVYIDGIEVETIDQYSSTAEYQKVVYSKTDLKSGTHTVKIEVLGEKQDVAGAANVSIDKIVIKNGIESLDLEISPLKKEILYTATAQIISFRDEFEVQSLRNSQEY